MKSEKQRNFPEIDQAYFTTPVLTHQQEIELAKVIEAGDGAASERARAKLVRANMRLVLWMAKKQTNRGLSLPDLVQEGSIGLMRAIDKFDYRRGLRFSTYAAWWIRHCLNRALSDQSRTIRMPVHFLEAKHKVARFAEQFAQEHGRKPSPEETAAALSISVEKVREILLVPSEPISLDAPLYGDEAGKIGDLVADSDMPSALEKIASQGLREEVRAMLHVLTPREQHVLRMRFGIDHPDNITLEQVGRTMAVTRERVRQIEAQALGKLRAHARARELESYLEADTQPGA